MQRPLPLPTAPAGATLEATVREATRQEYVCHADAEAAARLRAQQIAYITRWQ
jgi:hypothetical protein